MSCRRKYSLRAVSYYNYYLLTFLFAGTRLLWRRSSTAAGRARFLTVFDGFRRYPHIHNNNNSYFTCRTCNGRYSTGLVNWIRWLWIFSVDNLHLPKYFENHGAGIHSKNGPLALQSLPRRNGFFYR